MFSHRNLICHKCYFDFQSPKVRYILTKELILCVTRLKTRQKQLLGQNHCLGFRQIESMWTLADKVCKTKLENKRKNSRHKEIDQEHLLQLVLNLLYILPSSSNKPSWNLFKIRYHTYCFTYPDNIFFCLSELLNGPKFGGNVLKH